LKEPEMNLEIGQKYVGHLLEQGAVDNELMSLAIAYNAGPGNLRKWKKELGDIDDPLLFIEMIPMAETRNYVERVLANYWIYRMRLGQPMPSLDAVAEGKWAVYTPMDDHGASVRLASAFKPFRVADNVIHN
jgi:soluble lytic murein transglycosylase-like protein